MEHKHTGCEDLIRKRTVIDFIEYHIEHPPENFDLRDLIEEIKDEPPVTPKQEPCEDAISREAVWDVMQELWGTSGELMDRLMALPSVTPQPKTGHWIDEFGGCECSECGCLEAGYYDYCPNCGAKMVEPESEGQDADSD